ncbi:hypothetical protein V8D89_009763 [Ganoderma adspersum]
MFPVVIEPSIPPWDLYSTSQSLTLYSSALWPCIILLVLSTALMGLFTALVLFAVLGFRHPPVSVLFVIVVMMYASAVLHWATLLFDVIGYYDVTQAYAAQLLCQCTTDETVILGDAIVWWRVWTIWPHSLVVRGTCVILLSATLGSGIINSMDSCQKAAFSVLVVSNLADIPSGSFYQSDLFGLAASVLSLASNMVATILSDARLVAILMGTGAVSSSEPKALTQFDYFVKGCLILI